MPPSSPQDQGDGYDQSSIIGVDLAERAFQLHGATAEGEVVIRKKLSQAASRLHGDASGVQGGDGGCATGRHWARTPTAPGGNVRLIAPKFVKPCVKNQKNDMAGAEATAKAASRPAMRLVEGKTPEKGVWG